MALYDNGQKPLDLEQYNAIAYYRLSKDDGAKHESDSIANQRKLICAFLRSNPNIHLIEEAQDDGYSGTNFDRPGFRSVLNAVQSKRVNCVIVKDLSRLGREYIETGKYLEMIFPSFGVRFIAINDDVDSENSRAGDDIIIPVKNIINEAYCRELSKKLRKQFRIQRGNGEFLGAFANYGYCKSPDDKHKLVVDDYAAEVVRGIFSLKLQGYNQQAIADFLNNEKVLSPADYKRSQGLKYKTGFKTSSQSRWSAVSISRILTNPIYIGRLVQGKRGTPNYKIKTMRMREEKDWVVVENNHAPIIEPLTFTLVQRMLERDTRTAPQNEIVYPLSGMVFCADCGSRMSFSSPESKHRDSDVVYDSDSSWQCSKYRNMYVSCTSHFIKTSTIEVAILNAIKAMTKEIIENEDEFAEQLQAAWENQNTQVSSESKKELHSVQKRIDELDALIRSLYENSVLGKIPERQYQRLMAQYDEEQTVCEARIAELKKELDVVETTKVDLKRFIKLIRKYKDCETLTDEMLYELVEKVVIHSASGGRTIYRQQQIDIYFNFIGDTFPSQIEISRGDKKNLTEQRLAKRKKYQKTAGENRKKKRAALREAAKTDPQAAAEYEALLQKGRERCRKYAQNKKLAQQEPADTVPIQFEPSFETPEEMKGESA